MKIYQFYLVVISLLLIIIFLTSCGGGNNRPDYEMFKPTGVDNPNIKEVHPKLNVYVEEFKAEAKKRNIPIDLSGLSIYVGEFDDPKIFAKTEYDNLMTRPMLTRIIFTEASLKNHPEQVRWLVFHEMGHAVLGLLHMNDKDRIMNDGATAGIYKNVRLKLTDQGRIDDLFYPQGKPVVQAVK